MSTALAMNPRLIPITVSPATTLREAMLRIEHGVRENPPAPWGMVLALTGGALAGIATDGDIRRALLDGASLDDPIGPFLTKNPLRVQAASPTAMLAQLYELFKARGGSESKYHQVLVIDAGGNVLDVVTPFELWRRSDIKIKTVTVVGLGYVGLTLALTLNEFGIRVVGVDANDAIRETLADRRPTFFERGLDQLIKKHAGRLLQLRPTLDANESDIFIISVGTPVDDQGRVVGSPLQEAAESVARVLKPHDLVIVRSTVPIGTTRSVVLSTLERISGLKADSQFFLAFAPERTAEGKALEELRHLPQVVGGYNRSSFDQASQFFQIFTRTIVAVDSLEAAEAVKLLNNTFRDVSFSFANEVAQVCDAYGLSARDVIAAANDGYVRNPIPFPSPGVGGPCLVKDPHLLLQSARAAGVEARLPAISRAINESMIPFVCEKVDRFCRQHGKTRSSARIFLAGMAFKGWPETSDLRHSPSADILRMLSREYKNIVVYDAVAPERDLAALDAPAVLDPAEGFAGADAALILNNHPSFSDLDIHSLAMTMNRPSLVFDPWGAYSREQLAQAAGVVYAGL